MRNTRLETGRLLRPLAFAVSLACLAAGPAFAQTGNFAAPDAHVVRPGDTLWDLSRRYLMAPLRWPEIQRENRVVVPERLRPGQVLTLGNAATVVELSGDVVRHRSNDAATLALGMYLQPDDVVVTGRQGFLTLELSDGSRVVVPSSSAVRLVALAGRATKLELLDGRIESYVEKRKERDFEIRTRTFAMGVRGTHFRVASDPGRDRVEVLEGSVLAASLAAPGNRALLNAGTGAALAEGQAAAGRALLRAPSLELADRPGIVAAAAVEGAAGYRLQLARDPDFLQLVAEAQAERPSFDVATTLPRGFYHARLSALDDADVEGRPGRGIVFAPRGDRRSVVVPGVRRSTDGRYEIRWPAASAPAHVFELARSPDFAAPLARVDGDFPDGVSVGPIDEPGRYYWRCSAASGATMPTACSGSFEVSSLDRAEVPPR